MITKEVSEFDFQPLPEINLLLNSHVITGAFFNSYKSTAYMSDSFVSSPFKEYFKNIVFKTDKKYEEINRSPVCLFKTSDVYFMPNFGVIISENGDVYKESFEEARWVTPTKAQLPGFSIADGEAEFNPPESIETIERAFICMPLGSRANYGHFIIDCLTSLSIYKSFIETHRIPLVFPKLKDWQRAHLALLELTVPILERDEDILKINTAFHSNIMNHFLHNLTSDVSDLAEMQINNISVKDRADLCFEKLFLSRKGQLLRQFEQEDLLIEELKKLGFVIISPDEYSVEEQIFIFRNAKIIVGATGAGFANVAYCSPAAVIVEIMPSSFDGNVWVRNLCAVRHCYWLPIIIPEAKPSEPTFVEGVLRSEGGLKYDPFYDIQLIIEQIEPLIKLIYKHEFLSKDISSEFLPQMGDIRSLKVIAMKHKTDKQGAHNYADNYDLHFKKYRDQKVKILEIGIGGYDNPKAGGESLRMWKEYFPKGLIVGLDYYDKSNHQEDRIVTYRGSQDDHMLLKQIDADLGPFDIIIDDGSHMNSHVLSSFACLFPLLKTGGIYAVEDIQTSYWKKVFGGSSIDLDNKNTSMGFFKSLSDGLNYKEFENPDYVPTYFDRNITSIQFYHNQVFIYKNPNVEESNVVINNRLPDAYSSYVAK